ncbi:MAG: hypothetical protein K2X82_32845 [Gemmataceae bacterium]|nr:hypothetical protein [Gemmataceae bacterium]
MKTHLIPVGTDGPLVPILVGLPFALVHSRRASGSPIPPPVVAEALIDTGADVTVLDPAVLAPLVASGLPVRRTVFVNSPALGGVAPLFEYEVGLTVAADPGVPKSGLTIRTLLVVERQLGALGYQALVGRDVLDQCVLVYDGPGRRAVLGY